jgi:hypothetical protein
LVLGVIAVARKIVHAVLICVYVGGIAVFSAPATFLPARIRPDNVVKGDFSGAPVEITIPGSKPEEVWLTLKIRAGAGTCRVSHRNPAGDVLGSLTMGAGKWRARLPAGDMLVIEPGEAGGGYRIAWGSQWGLFGSMTRLVAVTCCIGGLAALAAARSRKVVSRGRRIGARRIGLAAVVAVASGLFLYSTVHEFGHYIVGVMLGGEVNEVVWTVLSGEEPHVSFTTMPEGAGPWMSAGGPVVSTLAGVVLIAIWLACSRRMPWYLSICLVVPGVLFLFGNVGCIFELFDSGAHMNRLSAHLGLRGVARVLFELLPLLVSLVMYALVARRIRAMSNARRPSQVGEDEQGSA